MMDKERILIVEDETIVAKDIEYQLSHLGYKPVAITNSGEQAIKLIKDHQPELIIMDIRLKGKLDGIETAEIIKNEYDIPVIYLTAFSELTILERAKLTTPYAYIMKPFEEKELRVSIDFTLYKHKIEKRIKESEERFRSLFEQAPLGYQTLDDKGKIININETWLRILGYSAEDVVGKWFGEFISDSDVDLFQKEFPKFKSTGEIFGLEFEMKRKDGTTFLTSFNGKANIDEHGNFKQTHCIINDITKQKQFEQILKNTAEQWLTTFDSTKDSIMLLDKDFRILRANKATSKFLGKSFTDIIGQKCYDLFKESNFPLDMCPFQTAAKNKRHFEVEIHIPEKDNWILVSLDPILDENGSIISTVHVMRDISEVKKKEEELQQSQDELRNLTIYMDSRMEEERKKIAREIHDGLGQLLTALKIDMSWIKKKIISRQDGLDEKITSMIKLLDSGVKMVQKISMELRPGILDDLGLISAIKMQSREFWKRNGIKCETIFEPEEFEVDYELSTTVFRVLLEAFTNIVRHSKATKVQVLLTKENTTLILEIRDNGIGILDEQIASPLSFG
ncbi:MAG: PAS domain S-box protein, partial [Candidatus Cloacimonetes bacterium]|nr:PAS domain S-box protein [Candidatus Cloacimonadota bacterium]